jgi:dihydrofolate synthase / folylpolyglutamate synthase
VNAYAEALAYLYSFANYEVSRMSPRTDMRLTRMRRLLEMAGNPEQRFRSVLIAGTKGKGSTAAMIAAIAQASGIRTGLYSTPHLNTHRERICIDGELISCDEFTHRMATIRDLVGRYGDELGPPTTYELGTTLAFEYFAEHKVDLAVVEVGLGGRLDATNVLSPEISVITPISYDHVEVLGTTLTLIATEKAGIIKPETPVVAANQHPEAMAVIERVARERAAPLSLAPALEATSRPTKLRAGDPLPRARQCARLPAGGPRAGGPRVCITLLGQHQLANAGVAVAVARQLGIGDEAVTRGLEAVRWAGRLEILRDQPLVVVDGAHNVDSMEKLAAAIRVHFDYDRLRLIVGFSADKDIRGMAAVVNEIADEVVLTRSRHPRSADPEGIIGFFPTAHIASTLDEALAGQGPRELVVIAGSLYLAGEARLALGLVGPEDQDEL